ncbi:MAG TPA: RNA-binding protein [Rhodospirillaceae bacterium]|nr:RNA-binding protein [Rhodospirillaceae bacterium]
MAEDQEDSGPCRRCIVTAVVRPVECMVRFGISPDGAVVPDVAARLPGRGLWLSADRDVVNTAARKGLFAKAARRRVEVQPDLADLIERLLLGRCIDLIGLGRRAGQAVAGFEKVRGELKAGRGRVVLAASDGAADSREKVLALARGLPVVTELASRELGAAFGRDHAVHGLMAPGRLAERFLSEAGRLAGFRTKM